MEVRVESFTLAGEVPAVGHEPFGNGLFDPSAQTCPGSGTIARKLNFKGYNSTKSSSDCLATTRKVRLPYVVCDSRDLTATSHATEPDRGSG